MMHTRRAVLSATRYNVKENAPTLLQQQYAALAERKQAIATLFYDELWRRYPGSKELFRQTRMPQQKTSLIELLDKIVAQHGSLTTLTTELENMGIRHRAYGVEPQHYSWVADAMMRSLARVFAQDWTLKTQTEWGELLRKVMAKMQKGAAAIDGKR